MNTTYHIKIRNKGKEERKIVVQINELEKISSL